MWKRSCRWLLGGRGGGRVIYGVVQNRKNEVFRPPDICEVLRDGVEAFWLVTTPLYSITTKNQYQNHHHLLVPPSDPSSPKHEPKSSTIRRDEGVLLLSVCV